MRVIRRLAMLVFAAISLARAADEPFAVRAQLETAAPGIVGLSVWFEVREGHYLYEERLSVSVPPPLSLVPRDLPVAKRKYDEFSGETNGVYEHDVTFVYDVVGELPPRLTLTVGYQGCSATLCFPPRKEKIELGAAGDVVAAPAAGVEVTVSAPPDTGGSGWRELMAGFTIAGCESGYVDPSALIAFLGRAESGLALESEGLGRLFADRGAWLGILFILLGGLALNLTPCVLPMIPVNIAIIGAGAQASSKGRGFALGGAYGAGIAIVYGGLGSFVVLTGAKFGTINSSPWFNVSVAAVFLVLSLGMFDILRIDLSRFQNAAGPSGGGKGKLVTAFVLGGIAALLAGACVAPVVIWVLVFSTDLYNRGQSAGVLLPFLLGIGMALPWPFAGAGLSFLPKPGRWMERVKQVFGVIILLAALWYGALGVSLFASRSASHRAAVIAAQEAASDGWLNSLEEGLTLAREQGTPVFVDFWASWCKACLKMEKTTFLDPSVEEALAPYTRVKFRAEDVTAGETKAVLDHFGVIGLPSYVVLVPVPARP